MTINSNQAFRNFCIFAVVLISFSLIRCGSEKDAFIVPGGGQISISGQALQPLLLTDVAIAVSGSTTNITLSSSQSGFGGQFLKRSIKLSIPVSTAPSIGTPIPLTSTSTLIETTTTTSGAVISTTFTSAKTKGTVFLTSFAPNSAVGNYQAVFTDATGRTRAIFNGTFTFNS